MRDPSQPKITNKFSIDIELTNACNASCTFCPRDHTPGVGIIAAEHFYRAVDRGLEHPGTPFFSFCGTGDCLMNKHVEEYVAYIAETGNEINLATNGHLMTEEKASALIEAGLCMATFNIASRGKKYTQDYGLDFETTHGNILRFIQLARGRCEVRIALVLHDSQDDYAEEEAYWRTLGIERFVKYQVINRAGSLFTLTDSTPAQVHTAKQTLLEQNTLNACVVPYFFIFIGWDGHYYLCSSDWQKQVRLGHVATHTIAETFPARQQAVETRSPICKQCTSDPVNRFLEQSAPLPRRANEKILASS